MTRTHIISVAGVTAAGSFVFLIMQLSLFAQPGSNGNITGTHEGTGDAVNTASWETRELPNMHFRFKLPPGYKQKQWAVVVGTPASSATCRTVLKRYAQSTRNMYCGLVPC